MNAYMHTCAHVCMYARIYAYMPAYMHIWAHICIYERAHACVRADMRIRTQLCLHARVYAYVHTYIHIVHGHMFAPHICMYACIFINIYIYIYIYMHICAHICQGSFDGAHAQQVCIQPKSVKVHYLRRWLVRLACTVLVYPLLTNPSRRLQIHRTSLGLRPRWDLAAAFGSLP